MDTSSGADRSPLPSRTMPETEPETGRILTGDVLALLPTLESASVDAVVTDPPYSSGGRTSQERTRRTVTQKYVTNDGRGHQHPTVDYPGDNRDQRGWTAWCALWLSECLRLTVPGGSCLVACDWRQLPALTDAVQAAGWVWSGVVVWAKPRHRSRPTRGGFWRQCEYYVWGTNGRLRTDHEVYLPGVIEAPAPGPAERQHPTEKPLALMRELVQVAPERGLVLDPFAGSGATGAAAVETGRRFTGAELSPHYAQVAADRLAAVQPALPAGEDR